MISGRNSQDSGNATMSSNISHKFANLDISDSDSEVLLGDLSLQEIAELHLSLHSTPSNSPMNFDVSPRNSSSSKYLSSLKSRLSPSNTSVPAFSHIGSSPVLLPQPFATPRPLLSPPAAGATTVCKDTDVKPSLTTLMQRLQAIKSTMKQPAPVSRIGNSDLFTPSQHKRPIIKLELESPP